MMQLRKEHKKFIIIIFFGIISFVSVGTSILIQNRRNTSSTEAASINFDQYCENGVYYAKKDGKSVSCGRAPNCDGRSYESVEGMDWRSNAECWVEDYFGGDRCKAYCAGNIPLCCYKLAETKNSEDCTWPERGYCLPSQCQGVGDNCGGPIGTWCTSIDKCVSNKNDIPVIPLSVRLGGQPITQTQPTNTQAPQATATPTTKPQATSTPLPPTATLRPNQPTPTSGSQPTYEPIPTGTQLTTTQPTYLPPPTNPPLPTNTPFPTNTPYQLPNIEIKTPKELAQKVINPKNIQKLNNNTEKVLSAPKEGLDIIKRADRSLERTTLSWIERVRIFIENLIN